MQGQRCLKAALALSASLILSGAALGQTSFYEDFESLTLGPNVEEASQGVQVWTKTPPAGWVVDDSKMPGVGTALDGRTEWAGWSFARRDWWTTVDGQRRGEFLLGVGTIMIADPDEWDDSAHEKGFFESYVTTQNAAVTASAANTLVLAFDSSWRPEGFDDGGANWPVGPEGEAINNQTALIRASFNGGEPVEILRWDSQADGPFFKEDAPNESILIPINNPGNLTNLKLTFGMEKGANDWWWAVDNITVGTPPLLVGLSATGVELTARVAEGLGKTVDQTKPVTVTLDGTVVPNTKIQEGSQWIITHNQDPKIWAPKSSHTVKVAYTSNEGKAIEETRTFIAPSYSTASSTPTVVTATITEPAWLTVNEAAGVSLKLDGATVTPASVTRPVNAEGAPGNQIIIRYTSPTVFAPKSLHTLEIGFTTAGGTQVVDPISFVAPDYKIIPTAYATALGTGAQPGLRFRTHQIETNRPTSIAAAEAQLLGQLGPSIHDASAEVNGAFDVTYVNMEQAGGNAGNFTGAAEGALAVQDDLIPGIGDLTDNITGDIRTFVEFPAAGLYTMVVNSDDGFGLWTGTTNSPTAIQIGAVDASRGAADTLMYFRIDQPGVYFFRLLWFEGGGGASVEWFSVNADGSRALVNGTQTGALKSYKVRTVPEPTLTPGGISGYTVTDGKLVLTYSGTLMSSSTLGGTYTAVAGATSPYSVTPGDGQAYYSAK